MDRVVLGAWCRLFSRRVVENLVDLIVWKDCSIEMILGQRYPGFEISFSMVC